MNATQVHSIMKWYTIGLIQNLKKGYATSFSLSPFPINFSNFFLIDRAKRYNSSSGNTTKSVKNLTSKTMINLAIRGGPRRTAVKKPLFGFSSEVVFWGILLLLFASPFVSPSSPKRIRFETSFILLILLLLLLFANLFWDTLDLKIDDRDDAFVRWRSWWWWWCKRGPENATDNENRVVKNKTKQILFRDIFLTFFAVSTLWCSIFSSIIFVLPNKCVGEWWVSSTYKRYNFSPFSLSGTKIFFKLGEMSIYFVLNLLTNMRTYDHLFLLYIQDYGTFGSTYLYYYLYKFYLR